MLETCAADGSCQLACPVGIDTGKLVKELRAARHTGAPSGRRWRRRGAGARSRAPRGRGCAFGGPLARRTERGAALPGPAGGKLPATTRAGAAAVYVPSCTNRIFAGSPAAALVAVSARAGQPLWIPEDVAGSCCGLPWSSKGFAAAHREKANAMVERALALERGGRAADRHRRRLLHRGDRRAGGGGPRRASTPSASPSSRSSTRSPGPTTACCPGSRSREKLASAAIHPTCATRRLGLTPRLARPRRALADDVYLPPSSTCCGFAGDRGISHPELTAAATAPRRRAEVAADRGRPFDAHLSSNRTCEIGMERATGAPYESVLLLLERLTRRPA